MKIRELEVTNLRSIVSAAGIRASNLFALVGENNTGKSNLLVGIEAFLAGGSGGLKDSDFNNPDIPIKIKVAFHELNEFEKKRWRKYLVNEELILEKQIWIERDSSNNSHRIKSAYHGYEAKLDGVCNPVRTFM